MLEVVLNIKIAGGKTYGGYRMGRTCRARSRGVDPGVLPPALPARSLRARTGAAPAYRRVRARMTISSMPISPR